MFAWYCTAHYGTARKRLVPVQSATGRFRLPPRRSEPVCQTTSHLLHLYLLLPTENFLFSVLFSDLILSLFTLLCNLWHSAGGPRSSHGYLGHYKNIITLNYREQCGSFVGYVNNVVFRICFLQSFWSTSTRWVVVMCAILAKFFFVSNWEIQQYEKLKLKSKTMLNNYIANYSLLTL